MSTIRLVWVGSSKTYVMLGITYLVMAATRIAGMILDRSVVRSNIISLATEIVLGVVLVL